MFRSPLLTVLYAQTILRINSQSPSAIANIIFLTPLSIFLFSVRTNPFFTITWRCPVDLLPWMPFPHWDPWTHRDQY